MLDFLHVGPVEKIYTYVYFISRSRFEVARGYVYACFAPTGYWISVEAFLH